MTSRQLNIRLESDDRDRLDALAYLARRQPSVLARAIVLEYLHRHQNEPCLEAALNALLTRDAAEADDAVAIKIHNP